MKKRSFLCFLLALCLLLTSCGGTTDGAGNNNDGGNTEVTNGWKPEPRVMSAKGGAGGIVVIIHDDGAIATAEILDGLFEKYGLVGDVALLANRVWDNTAKTPKTAEVEKWQRILDTGRWKIVSHSMTHTWWGTATENADGSFSFADNEAKVYDEVVGSQAALREAFPGQRVLTFAYPGFWTERQTYAKVDGKVSDELVRDFIYSEASRELIDETYISARNAYAQNYPYLNGEGAEWNYIASRQLGNSTGAAIADIYKARYQRFVVFFMHNVMEVPEDQLEGFEYPNNTMAAYYMDGICAELAKDVKKGYLWNTHYEDAVLYMREAQSATVSATGNSERVEITLKDGMDNEIYNYPLTVRMNIPDEWEAVRLTVGDRVSYVLPRVVDGLWVLDVDIVPDEGVAVIEPVSLSSIPQ